MSEFLDAHKDWVKTLSPTLWIKLERLSSGEDWVLTDPEFEGMLEQFFNKINKDPEFLLALFSDECFALLTQVLAYMHISVVLKLFNLAKPQLMFEATVLQWCTDNVDIELKTPTCNVLISRFDWIIQQDLNNRIFGKYTRQRVKKLLNSISR